MHSQITENLTWAKIRPRQPVRIAGFNQVERDYYCWLFQATVTDTTASWGPVYRGRGTPMWGSGTNWHLPSTSTRIKSRTAVAADLQYPLKGTPGGDQVWGTLCSGKNWQNRPSSVQLSPQSCLTLRLYGLQHARPPCPSPTLGVYSNSCPLSQWCHPTISSSVVPSSSCLQSFPASGSFQMSQFFTSGGQNIGASASASVLSMNIQDLFPLGWTSWISLLSKGLSRVFSNTTVPKHQFFGA